ncbi:MAG: hypothetical protein KKF56_04455 [Nanoarchaeota archaeon]|nr:hypothetical protein [Nanoarchaeota archaeon]
MTPRFDTEDPRALRLLDAAGVDYRLVETQKPTEPARAGFEVDPSDYLFLEAKKGRDGYPDLLVCKYRLGATSAVQAAGQTLGLNLQNSTTEKNGRGYVGHINKKQAVRLNLALEGRTQNFRIAKDVFALLLSGKAYDGNGKKVSRTELSAIFDEIAGVRAPWRSEWYEDDFTQGDDGLVLNKNYAPDGENLVPRYSQRLTTCLMRDKGIDLRDWVANSTAQGFPRKGVKSGDTYFWHPRQDRAAGVGACAGGSFLVCGRYPQGSYSRLGVRHVREAHDTAE